MGGTEGNKKTGALLKARREKSGLSFEQIYELTRIQPEILKGIEEGRAKAAPVFLKGFIKTYARALGIKEGELQTEGLAEPRREPSGGKEAKKAAGRPAASQKPENPSPPKKTASSSHGGGASSFASAKKLAAVFGAGAAGAALAVFLFQADFKGSESRPPSLNAGQKSHKKIPGGDGAPAGFQMADSQKPAAGAIRQPKPEALPPGALPAARKEPGFLSQVRQNAFQREILIRAKTAPLKIYFRADSGSIVIKGLEPLQWYSIKAVERIYLRFDGDSSAADLFYNGREVQRKNSFFEKSFGGG